MKYHFTTKIKNECWQRCGEIRTPYIAGGNIKCKMATTLGNNVVVPHKGIHIVTI